MIVTGKMFLAHAAKRWASLLSASALAFPSLCTAQAASVRIDGGLVRGVEDRGAAAFLGLPYAAPPTGDLRWRSPQAVVPWEGVRPADHFGPNCAQHIQAGGFGPWTQEYVASGETGEDCLYLNVWTGQNRSTPRPVFVWIHGGGFNQGSGSIPIYNGAHLAAQGVVVVTINYRLGAPGFLAHPELTREAEARGEPPGNYGLQDTIAALRWVQRNIAAFGGDPKRVTVGGQSAGAVAVHALLASPLADGLFQRAIVESGLPDLTPTLPLATAQQSGSRFATGRGATTSAELRALSTPQLTSAFFLPIVDGKVLPAAPGEALIAGRAKHVPILIGANSDESSSSRPPGFATEDPKDLTPKIDTLFQPSGALFRPLYPAATPAERIASSRAAPRDKTLGALFRWGNDWAAAKAGTPVYMYFFEHAPPGPDAERFGAFHTSEVPYVFQNLDDTPQRKFTAADHQLSLTMSRYWVNFIKSGNPNGPQLPHWPTYAPTKPNLIRFGADVTVAPVLPATKLEAVKAWIQAGGKPQLF